MRSKLVYVATVALLASGMAFAQSSGQNNQGDMNSQSGSAATMAPQAGQNDTPADMPAVQAGDNQSGEASQAKPMEGMPEAMSTPATPSQETNQVEESMADESDQSQMVDPAPAPPTSDETEAPVQD